MLSQGRGQGAVLDDRAARRIDQPCRGFHQREFGRADQSAGPLAENEVDGKNVRLPEQFVLPHVLGVCCGGFSAVRFSLQAITLMPKACPIRATSPPILPSPSTPNVFPFRSLPILRCQPPERSDAFSAATWRALARMRAHVISIVGVES